MIFMPPGSAKSTYASHLFPPWFLAQRPDLKIIAASNTMDLAQRFSGYVRNYVRPNTADLGYSLRTDNQGVWETTRGGEYKAIGIGGAIAGFRADLALIDDPIRLRAEAESDTIRDKIWDWFQSDLRTRLRPNGRIVLIQTRWHADDLGGRLLEAQPGEWRVISLPATAKQNDPLGRQPGELLWSNDPSYPYGAEIARVKAEYEQSGAMRDWHSLYEQDPRPGEGALFKTTQIAVVDTAPAGGTIVRAWDLAATAQVGARDPDWTVGLKLARYSDGRFGILDVVRLRGGPDEVEAAIVNTASQDGRGVRISLPQDPGQAGKTQVLYLTRKLAGYMVESSPETGDKATRAAPFASQVNAGNVFMVRAPWNRALLDEMAGFPAAAHDDCVDAGSRALSMLVAPPEPARWTSSPISFGR